MKELDITLYLVSDSTNMQEDVFLYKIEEACIGGVTLVQLREKERTTKDYVHLANKVRRITDRYGIPLMIDDRADVAFAVNAAGVHVGRDDLSVKDARRLLGPGKVVGATAKTIKTAQQAERDGADYLGVGAIFPTTTKVKTVLTSVDTLRAICHSVHIPVGAIGGLHRNNCDILKETGVRGMCVVSAIMKQEDTRKAALDLKMKLHTIL